MRRSSRGLLLICALLLSACAGRDGGQDGAPRSDSKRAFEAPEPIAERLPRSRYGNPETYVVFGQKYRVRASSEGFRQRGLASWYGTKFHGRRTSSGEIFDMYALTAAHRELPIPCIAQVTNLRNGRSIRVRINDRGPFHPDRVLDLSWAAATRLGVISTGTAPVEIVVLDGQTSVPPPTPIAADLPQPGAPIATSQVGRPSQYFLQVGAYRDITLAQGAVQRFRAMGYSVAPDAPLAGGWHRIWLGPWPDAPAAEMVAAQLADQRIQSLLIAQ